MDAVYSSLQYSPESPSEEAPIVPGYVGYGPLGYGIYYLMAAPPAPPITVEPGDTVKVTVRYQHRGAACDAVLYCSMGNRILTIFDEDPQITRQKSIHLDREDSWVIHTETIDIPIPGSYTGFGWKDIYAKIMVQGKDKTISPEYDNCIEIDEVVPEFQLIEITQYESL